MNRKTILSVVIVVIISVVFFCTTFVPGISELNAKPAESSLSAQNGEIVEYDVTFAKEVYEIQHKLLGLIPTQSEHFYLTLSGDDLNPLVVRADEKWFSENFSADGAALSEVRVSGLVKEARSKEGLNLNSVNDQLDSLGGVFRIDSELYADAMYVPEAIIKIISGVIFAAAVLLVLLLIILLSLGVLVRGTAGMAVMTAAAVILMLAFIVIMVFFL